MPRAWLGEGSDMARSTYDHWGTDWLGIILKLHVHLLAEIGADYKPSVSKLAKFQGSSSLCGVMVKLFRSTSMRYLLRSLNLTQDVE